MATRLTSRPNCRVLAGLVGAAVLGTTSLSGCEAASSAHGEAVCAAPEISAPASAHAGETIKVPIDNLYADCSDQGDGGPNPVATTVTLELFDGESQRTVATGSADVGPDARAVVEITIPADASGGLVFRLSGLTMADVRIVPAA